MPSQNTVRAILFTALLWLAATGPAAADTIFSNTHTYGFGGDPNAVVIRVDVISSPGQYLWQYTVTNNSYDPIPGQTNGFAGFALALCNLVPDLGNVSGPPEWDNSTGIDIPNGVEWDRDDDDGGIMPGETGVFSFTTLPRPWTLSDGLFHTWIPVPDSTEKTQFDFVYFDGQGPEVPDGCEPPLTTPVPAGWMLFGIGTLGLGVFRRWRTS